MHKLAAVPIVPWLCRCGLSWGGSGAFCLGQEAEVVAEVVYSIRQVGRGEVGGRGGSSVTVFRLQFHGQVQPSISNDCRKSEFWKQEREQI